VATGGTWGGADGLLVPNRGAWLGAFVGTGTFEQLETTLGRKLAIVHHFFGWTDDWLTPIPSALSSGKIPLITWETWNAGVGVPLDEILSGAHDSLIRSRATAAKNIGQRFFLRWGHEMNGNWYPWDGFHNGANAAAASKYIAVYRRIHDIFVAQGATNVIWVFCPNVDSVPQESWNQWANYYPGDDYVDWLAFDGYNWGSVLAGSAWQSFSAMASRIYPSLAAKNKPIMIPETASAELGGDKPAWIASVVPALASSYPNIKALVWFHMNKETDWRLDSSAATRSASIAMASASHFLP
jgi:beta-mannanase